MIHTPKYWPKCLPVPELCCGLLLSESEGRGWWLPRVIPVLRSGPLSGAVEPGSGGSPRSPWVGGEANGEVLGMERGGRAPSPMGPG